jgi:hypothetical protein
MVRSIDGQSSLRRWGKRFQQGAAWIVAAGVVAFFGYCVHRYVAVGDKEFEIFFNAKTAQALYQITVPLMTIIIFDWLYPGRTIETILDVHRLSAPYNKRTAAMFLLGVGFIALMGMRGGLF